MNIKMPTVLSIDSTLDLISNSEASVVRFGDGELEIIFGKSIPYQKYSKRLSDRLYEILKKNSTEKELICLPEIGRKDGYYTDSASIFWGDYANQHVKFFESQKWAKFYGNSFISRPYMDLENKSNSERYFDKLKKLWSSKDLLIVEGENTRAGIGNDLFSNASSVLRVICPSQNAYEYCEEIKNAIRKHSLNRLVLIMLGPTAKVIVDDLVDENIRIIDLGHIDSEYEWFKRKVTKRTKLKHKHTAEYNYDQDITPIQDPLYFRQIVEKITCF